MISKKSSERNSPRGWMVGGGIRESPVSLMISSWSTCHLSLDVGIETSDLVFLREKRSETGDDEKQLCYVYKIALLGMDHKL